MKQRPEILAPAGSLESAVAAVNSGADAIYLGQKSFSARASAANFTSEQLKEAVRISHRAGTKVYQAVNTIVFDHEIPSLYSCIETACEAGIDGFIIQDLAVAKLLHDWVPQIPRHASTQMSVTSLSGVLEAERLGFQRAVLARELTLEEIRFIAKETPIELEVFVHGALCMSVSGQCYLSAMIGSRSANRGGCAQPCRLPFSVDGVKTADLSLKDLSTLDLLPDLAEAGVTSFKIEGRMKRPEYVGAAVRAIASKMQGETPDMDALRSVFSRGGFTNGYILGRRTEEMFGVRSKEDVTAAQSVLGKLASDNQKVTPRIPLHASLSIKEGVESRLTLKDASGNTAVVFGTIPEKARTKPTDEERAVSALSKFGGTPYYLNEFSFASEGEPIMPASALNAMRRGAVEELDRLRTGVHPYKMSSMEPLPSGMFPKGGCEIRSRYASLEQIREIRGTAYLPLSEALRGSETLSGVRDQIIVELPRVRYDETQLKADLKKLERYGFGKIGVQNLAHFYLAREMGAECHGMFSMNCVNSISAEELAKAGAKDLMLSYECKLTDAARIRSSVPIGLVGYGYLPLMIFRNCPIRARKGCQGCPGRGVTDRLNNRFQIRCDGEMAEMYNYLPLVLSDKKKDLSFADFEMLYFTMETPGEVQRIEQMYRNEEIPTGKYTRGLYYRGIE